MKYRYLLVDDYGSVWGCNDTAEVQRRWDAGSHLVVDLESLTTFEESKDDPEQVDHLPIPDIMVPEEPLP